MESGDIGTITTDQEKSLRIDSRILAEAGLKKSPAERLSYFNEIYDQVLETNAPSKDTVHEERVQSETTLLNILDIKRVYKTLFSRDIVADVPALNEQFQLAQEKHKGNFIPQRSMSAILELAERAASISNDPHQLP